jgi:hypothetical protein
MTKDRGSQSPDNARRAGRRAALLCAALGLLLAALLAWLFQLGHALSSWHGWLLFLGAVASVLGVAATLGGRAGVCIQKGKSPVLVGIALALATVLLPTVAISLLVWLYSGPSLRFGVGPMLHDLAAFVLKPLVWVASAGTLPACILGVCYAGLVRRAHRRLDADR